MVTFSKICGSGSGGGNVVSMVKLGKRGVRMEIGGGIPERNWLRKLERTTAESGVASGIIAPVIGREMFGGVRAGATMPDEM
jgi:hypothetical protein